MREVFHLYHSGNAAGTSASLWYAPQQFHIIFRTFQCSKTCWYLRDAFCQIGDFGTSTWTQHSTGLTHYTAEAGQTNHKFSLAWSAPEVELTRSKGWIKLMICVWGRRCLLPMPKGVSIQERTSR